MATSGIDIVSIDTSPAQNMTPAERKQGWGQIGASTAVKAVNIGVAVAASAGLGYLGGQLLGSAGAVAGAAAGLLGGIAACALGEGNGMELPFRPLKQMAAIAGAEIGAAASRPLQSLFPNAVKEYQLTDAAYQHRVGESEIREFEQNLQPGDVILTLSDDDPMFHTIVSAQRKPLDFTHAAMYAGNGKIIEANTDTGQVGYRDTDSVLGQKAHVVAVRPHYKDGEAEKVVQQAKGYIGRPYDWFLSLGDKRLGCVELPFHAIKNGAPDHQVPISNLWGLTSYIFPSDFVLTSDSEVVASAGLARPASSMRMARYAWAAIGISDAT